MGRFEQAFKGKKTDVIRKLVVSTLLLNDLVERGLLTEQQKEYVSLIRTNYDKADALLTLLCKRSDAEFDEFCVALHKDNQQNIVQLIEPNFHKPTAQKEEVLGSFQTAEREEVLRAFQTAEREEVLGAFRNISQLYDPLQNMSTGELKELIEPDYGLLDQLYSNDVLDLVQCSEISGLCRSDNFIGKQKRVSRLLQYVQQGVTIQENNKSILEALVENSPFIDALNVTYQHHVVNYIEASGVIGNILGNDRPLSEQQRKRLHPCAILVEQSDMDSGDAELQIRLIRGKVISPGQLEDVNEQKSVIQMNKRLLQIMQRRSLANVILFIKDLQAIGQHKVVERLMGRGVFVGLKTEISDKTMTIEDKNTSESLFITYWKKFVKFLYERYLGGSYEAAERSCERLNKLGCEIYSVEHTNSILWHIKCRSLESLEGLSECYHRSDLVGILQSIFNCLCVNEGHRPTQLSVNWNLEEFERCRSYMRETSGLPFGSLVDQTHHMVTILIFFLLHGVVFNAIYCRGNLYDYH